jgi:hypothetical protein
MKISQQKRTVGFSDGHHEPPVQTPSGPERLAQDPLPQRFWVEGAVGLLSAVLLTLTVLMPDWIERLFGASPDAGDGSTEWRLVSILASISVVMFCLAGRTRKKHIEAHTPCHL